MDQKKWSGKLKKIKKFGVLGVVVLLAYFGVLHIKIMESSHQPIPEDAGYLIVLGARVKGTVPSLSLQYRIDKAADYLKANGNTVAIVSGGRGPGEDITEAEAMKQGLIKLGIAEARIILEDQSTSTKENIAFSKGLIPDPSSVGLIVSNDFHLYRAVKMAENEGLVMTGVPAKTPKIALVKSYIREYLAITKYYLTQLL
ncbi:YdcF family protein [Peribacillus sp. NPDC097295]|uniref:YdcF family protein n=1 Tax=Peribacillus sp. NPDC097295 TaxID=3364402 RepID=UPI0038020371